MPLRLLFLACFWSWVGICTVTAQQKPKMPHFTTRFPYGGVGLRFASDFTFFFNAERNPLTEGTFSTGNIGAFYKQYYKNGMMEIGLTFCYKERRGGFELPLVMKNYADNESTAFTSLEGDFKVGPRIWMIYPKFGFRYGYRFKQEGFLEPNAPSNIQLNHWYAMIPMGIAFELPTGFGSTGIGIYYNVGINDVIKIPEYTTPGRQRSVNFEIHVLLQTSKDK